MKLKTTLLLLFLSRFLFGQTDDSKFRIEVLEKSIIGKEFTFGEWNDKGDTETNLTYLGSLKNTKGETYKIMNSIWFWGVSGKTTSRILLFDNTNQYIGNYNMGTSSDLPTELKNGYLVFRNAEDDCDPKTETLINFNDEIPKSFFRKCTLEYGTVYEFEY